MANVPRFVEQSSYGENDQKGKGCELLKPLKPEHSSGKRNSNTGEKEAYLGVGSSTSRIPVCTSALPRKFTGSGDGSLNLEPFFTARRD